MQGRVCSRRKGREHSCSYGWHGCGLASVEGCSGQISNCSVQSGHKGRKAACHGRSPCFSPLVYIPHCFILVLSRYSRHICQIHRQILCVHHIISIIRFRLSSTFSSRLLWRRCVLNSCQILRFLEQVIQLPRSLNIYWS